MENWKNTMRKNLLHLRRHKHIWTKKSPHTVFDKFTSRNADVI